MNLNLQIIDSNKVNYLRKPRDVVMWLWKVQGLGTGEGNETPLLRGLPVGSCREPGHHGNRECPTVRPSLLSLDLWPMENARNEERASVSVCVWRTMSPVRLVCLDFWWVTWCNWDFIKCRVKNLSIAI